jgi:hypothetical protein
MGRRKRNPCVQKGATACPAPATQRRMSDRVASTGTPPQCDRALRRPRYVTRWWRSETGSSTTTLETTNGEGSALIGQRRQLMRRCHAGGNALSGVGRGAESTMRAQAVAAMTIAPITAIACRQPSAGMPMCARPSAA